MTHIIINESTGQIAQKGEPSQLMGLLASTYPYAQGWRLKPEGAAPAVVAVARMTVAAAATVTPSVAPQRVVVPGKTVDVVGAGRIAEQEAAAKAAGFQLPPTWFAAGTDMLDCGVARFRTLAKEHADLPYARAVFAEAAERFRAERRRDVVINDMAGAVLDATGTLRINGRTVGLTMAGLKALMARFPSLGWNYNWAEKMSPDARAMAITDGFARLRNASDSERACMLRVRDGRDGSPQLYAVVGPKFPGLATDADKCLMEMARVVASDARGEVLYNPETTEIIARATYNAPITLDPKVGDVFRGGIVATTRDDGRGKWRGSSSLTRIICINCTIAESNVDDGARVHRGNGEGFMRDIAQIMNSGMERIAPITIAFRDLRALQAQVMVEDENGGEVALHDREILPALADGLAFPGGDALALALKDAGIARDTAVELLLRSFDQEPGDDFASIANAVTRMAHQRELDAFQRFAVERASGILIPAFAAAAEA